MVMDVVLVAAVDLIKLAVNAYNAVSHAAFLILPAVVFLHFNLGGLVMGDLKQ